MRSIWISSNRMTVVVADDNSDTIRGAAPIAKRFLGQPLSKLVNWMDKQGGLRVERLDR